MSEEQEELKLKYHMRIRVFYEDGHFGPGVSALMSLVKEKGSLSAACKEMSMAYSKAWKIINKAETDLGFALMEGRRGGERGGRTVLTERGEEFLKEYIKFEAESREAVASIFLKHFDSFHKKIV